MVAARTASANKLFLTYFIHLFSIFSREMCLFHRGRGAPAQPSNSPCPCGCGGGSPAAPWPSGSGCAPCHRRGSQSRCQRRRWAGESAARLQVQTQNWKWTGLKWAKRWTDWMMQADISMQRKKDREATGHTHRELKSNVVRSWTKILTEDLLSLALFHPR